MLTRNIQTEHMGYRSSLTNSVQYSIPALFLRIRLAFGIRLTRIYNSIDLLRLQLLLTYL